MTKLNTFYLVTGYLLRLVHGSGLLADPVKCSDLKTELEGIICGDPDLLDADTRVWRRFDKILQQTNPNDREFFRREQAKWLEKRQTCDPQGDATKLAKIWSCLGKVYDHQLRRFEIFEGTTLNGKAKEPFDSFSFSDPDSIKALYLLAGHGVHPDNIYVRLNQNIFLAEVNSSHRYTKGLYYANIEDGKSDRVMGGIVTIHTLNKDGAVPWLLYTSYEVHRGRSVDAYALVKVRNKEDGTKIVEKTWLASSLEAGEGGCGSSLDETRDVLSVTIHDVNSDGVPDISFETEKTNCHSKVVTGYLRTYLISPDGVNEVVETRN